MNVSHLELLGMWHFPLPRRGFVRWKWINCVQKITERVTSSLQVVRTRPPTRETSIIWQCASGCHTPTRCHYRADAVDFKTLNTYLEINCPSVYTSTEKVQLGTHAFYITPPPYVLSLKESFQKQLKLYGNVSKCPQFKIAAHKLWSNKAVLCSIYIYK